MLPAYRTGAPKLTTHKTSHPMGRPKLSTLAVEARNNAILASLAAGLTPEEAAQQHGVDRSHVSRLRSELNQASAALDVFLAEALRNPPLPEWADDDCRARVLLRLASPTALQLSGGRFAAWTDEALRYAFGEAFHLDGDSDLVPTYIFVRAVTAWGCTQGADKIWRAPDASQTVPRD